MLLVFVEEIIEYFLVQESDALEVIARARLKADYLIDQSVGLVAEIGDVLLPLHFLLDVSRVVTDLQFDGVQRGRINLLQPLYGFLDKRLRVLLGVQRAFEVKLAGVLVENGLRNVGGQRLSDRIVELPALVDDHLDDVAQVCHFLLIQI